MEHEDDPIFVILMILGGICFFICSFLTLALIRKMYVERKKKYLGKINKKEGKIEKVSTSVTELPK